MDFFVHYFSKPLDNIFAYYFVLRAFSIFSTQHMLGVLFNSATGKQKKLYLQQLNLLERFYRFYILSITSYYYNLSRYLIAINFISSIYSFFLLTSTAICLVAGISFPYLIRIITLAAIFLLNLPPYLLSFFVTIYPDGHPNYRFNVYANYIKRIDVLRRKSLVKQIKKGLKMTPEEFAQYKKRRKCPNRTNV